MGGDGIRTFLSGQWGPTIPIAIAVLIVLMRNRRPRKLKIERMWMIPAIYGALMVLMFYYQPPPLTVAAIGVIMLGLVAGAVIGWQRARFTRLDIDPETHEMTSQASIFGIAFILVLMLGRRSLQVWLQSGEIGGTGLTVTVITDALATFAVATLATQRLEIWIRATKMLEEARAAKASALPAPVDQPPPADIAPSQPPIVQ